MLKDVKRNVIIVEKLAISRKVALILDILEEDLHLDLVPVLDPDQAEVDLILEIEEEVEEAHLVVLDLEGKNFYEKLCIYLLSIAVIDLIQEISIRKIIRERVTRSIEALTRREVEAQAEEAEETVVPEVEKIMKKMVTRAKAEVEVEANKIVETELKIHTRQRFIHCKRV